VQVLRRAAFAGIDDQQHAVGFLDGLERLLRHQAFDAADDRFDQAAGVDDDARAPFVADVTVLAVAREAGHVGDERVARPRQGIEQGRFADVGATDQGDDRQHINDPRARRCDRPSTCRLSSIT
jgi:hypothetical protein